MRRDRRLACFWPLNGSTKNRSYQISSSEILALSVEPIGSNWFLLTRIALISSSLWISFARKFVLTRSDFLRNCEFASIRSNRGDYRSHWLFPWLMRVRPVAKDSRCSLMFIGGRPSPLFPGQTSHAKLFYYDDSTMNGIHWIHLQSNTKAWMALNPKFWLYEWEKGLEMLWLKISAGFCWLSISNQQPTRIWLPDLIKVKNSMLINRLPTIDRPDAFK